MTTLDDMSISKAFYYISANNFLVIALIFFFPALSGITCLSASSLAVNFHVFKSANLICENSISLLFDIAFWKVASESETFFFSYSLTICMASSTVKHNLAIKFANHVWVFLLCVAFLMSKLRNNLFLHTAGQAKSETIWDLIRGVFNLKHTRVNIWQLPGHGVHHTVACLKISFHWSVVDSQCYVSFPSRAEWIRYTYADAHC